MKKICFRKKDCPGASSDLNMRLSAYATSINAVDAIYSSISAGVFIPKIKSSNDKNKTIQIE